MNKMNASKDWTDQLWIIVEAVVVVAEVEVVVGCTYLYIYIQKLVLGLG